MGKGIVLIFFSFILSVAFAQETSRPFSHTESKTFSSSTLKRPIYRTETHLQYSQSANIWETVSSLKEAKGSLRGINEILREKYGKPEETFSIVSVEVERSIVKESINKIYLKLSFEVLGFGLIQNPVVPELHAHGLVAGIVRIGHESLLSNLGMKVGIAAGSGREKRMDAISTDLIDDIPIRSGTLTLYGLDIDLNRELKIGSDFLLTAQGSLRETVVHATTPSFEEEDNNPMSVYHRWKTKFKLEKEFHLTWVRESAMGFELITGPQPLPVEFLPRTWDYVHDLYPLPELGTMLGTGLLFRASINRNFLITGHSGFYGGYWGGDLGIQWRGLHCSVATWGIETTAAYQVLGERLWQGSFGYIF